VSPAIHIRFSQLSIDNQRLLKYLNDNPFIAPGILFKPFGQEGMIISGGIFIMRRKYFFFTFMAAAMLLLGNQAASAQTGQLFGEVMMQQADGTTVPIAGAIVDVFRTDVAGKYQTKSEKSGRFVFAGLPYTGTYVITASAPNARPDILGDAKAGREVNYKLTLTPGDGKRLTDAEAKALIKGGSGSSGGGESAEDRKKRLDLEAENAKIMAGNKKIEESNVVVTRTAKAGNEFLAAKNYDAAIAQYNEGIAIDPTHPGQPVLLTNKSVALTNRGILRYNEAVTSKDEAVQKSSREAAISDWREAVMAAVKAVDFLKAEAAPADPTARERHNKSKYLAAFARADAYRLLVSKGDPTQVDAGLMAYQEYIALETDAAKKTKAQLDSAQMLLDAGSADKAYTEFQKALADNPESVDALLGAGLALFSTGDKAKYQEAANFLQRFVDKAPDTHKFKADAKAVLDNLKSQENVKPQKTTTTGGRRRG
jgi:tetratricopeptide (TPR) repeat protein